MLSAITSKVIQDEGQNFHFRPKDFSYVVFQGIAYISFGNKRPIVYLQQNCITLSNFFVSIKFIL
ncbi:hypothetical protein [Candidatus Tisiphia endosymbiont of Hybos culiciformis]|uniref:hypothetical protein n=1 Tax=Candidatus Tisiphia endosymbiont of Hybos culiciformis TaxID=3139331 RepID=UPI003CCAFE5A